MHYTIHQLRIFQKIVELRSITKASEELNLTQPAVSIQLKNFQDQFPIPLTEVTGRKLYITDFGEEIAIAARKILKEVREIDYRTLAFQGKLSGKLKIASASTGKYVIPYFLSSFLKEHPDIELAINVTNKSKVISSLEKNEVDFALVSVMPKKLKLHSIKLMPNSLYLIGNKDFDSSKQNRKRELFEKKPLIYREQGSATRNAMESFILRRQYTVHNKLELMSNEAVKQAVIAGLGLSIMPLIGIKNELKNNDLQIIPSRGLPIHTDWNLVWLKSKKLSPVASAYLDYLDKHKKEIILKNFEWINDYN